MVWFPFHVAFWCSLGFPFHEPLLTVFSIQIDMMITEHLLCVYGCFFFSWPPTLVLSRDFKILSCFSGRVFCLIKNVVNLDHILQWVQSYVFANMYRQVFFFLTETCAQLLEVIRLEGHSFAQEDAFVSRDIHLLQVLFFLPFLFSYLFLCYSM